MPHFHVVFTTQVFGGARHRVENDLVRLPDTPSVGAVVAFPLRGGGEITGRVSSLRFGAGADRVMVMLHNVNYEVRSERRRDHALWRRAGFVITALNDE